eukprot:TRINITY_DN3978_c0_g1_i2.p1 TRINITY_DN3978_c0_g1~~TRINITY_DN3978_c0_g1_i2.p1  ORF type:complete len:119 (+),score=15.96 TRINITY_DN3978_c0_g1_i2:119-475(+)
MIEESLGITETDQMVHISEEQQNLFKDWDWLNPQSQLAPSPQQLDVAFLKKHHQFPLGLQVYLVNDNINQPTACTGQGKIIFSLDELPIGVSYLSPHGALIKRTRQKTVKVMDTEIYL